jgi:alkylation response protein AidB-like acyl-CoA dehydrogenase
MVAVGIQTDEMVCAIAQEVADKYLAPRAEEYDRSGELPLENLKELARCGLMGLMVPLEYGGLGGTVTQFTKVSEILARACPSTSMVWGMHTNQYITLVEHGNQQQKAAFLPGIARGEILAAFATTEPETGAHLLYCNSAARKVDGGWRLTRTCPVVTSAQHTNLCFTITRANPHARGDELSMFMVPCDDKGVSRIGSWNTVGMRATQSSGLQFNNVLLTDLHLLGEEGKFLNISSSMMVLGLCGFAATWLGTAQAALDIAVEYAKKRVHRFSMSGDESGHSVASYASVQHQIAECDIRLHQNRAFMYEVARLTDEAKPSATQPVPPEQAAYLGNLSLEVRVAAAQAAIEVTTRAMRIARASGYRRDHLRIERYHRDALSSQAMGPDIDMSIALLGKLRLGYSWEEALQQFHV